MTKGTGYGRAAALVRFPIHFPVQPTLSVAGMHVLEQFGGAAQTLSADLGLVWQGW